MLICWTHLPPVPAELYVLCLEGWHEDMLICMQCLCCVYIYTIYLHLEISRCVYERVYDFRYHIINTCFSGRTLLLCCLSSDVWTISSNRHGKHQSLSFHPQMASKHTLMAMAEPIDRTQTCVYWEPNHKNVSVLVNLCWLPTAWPLAIFEIFRNELIRFQAMCSKRSTWIRVKSRESKIGSILYHPSTNTIHIRHIRYSLHWDKSKLNTWGTTV